MPTGRAKEKSGAKLLVPIIDKSGLTERVIGVASKGTREMRWGEMITGMGEIDLEGIVQYFKNFDVEGIEVWVEGMTKTGIFVVSLEANAGVKVILKPKKSAQRKSK